MKKRNNSTDKGRADWCGSTVLPNNTEERTMTEMTDREFQEKINYLGQERAARKLIIKDGFAKAEDVATMTSLDVCGIIVKHYTYLANSGERIILVRNEDWEKVGPYLKVLDR